MSSVCNENAEDERKKKIVKSAISTLSASELQAIKAVLMLWMEQKEFLWQAGSQIIRELQGL